MKAFTDIKQSKKLAEILPIESADMCYRAHREECGILDFLVTLCPHQFAGEDSVPCWSLAALLDQLGDRISDEKNNQWELVLKKEDVQYDIYYLNIWGEQDNIELDCFYDDLTDCCYNMVLKLKEKDLL